MPASVKHVLSATTPDNTSYEIRPSHWNSSHAVTLSAQGSEIIGAFSNANVTFGLETNGFVTASAPAGGGGLTNIKISAGTQSNLRSDVTFSDLNGLSFGLDAGTITGSYTVPTVTNSSWTVSDAGTSGTVGRLAFTKIGRAHV